MKRTPGVLALGIACICMQGCILVHTEKEYVCEQHGATVNEMEAVGKLRLETSRRDGYERIAQRQDLSDAEQVHLVNAATRRLVLETSRVDVLLTLIENPCFSAAGEAAIFKRLDRLVLETSKVNILEAISERKAKVLAEQRPRKTLRHSRPAQTPARRRPQGQPGLLVLSRLIDRHFPDRAASVRLVADHMAWIDHLDQDNGIGMALLGRQVVGGLVDHIRRAPAVAAPGGPAFDERHALDLFRVGSCADVLFLGLARSHYASGDTEADKAKQKCSRY